MKTRVLSGPSRGADIDESEEVSESFTGAIEKVYRETGEKKKKKKKKKRKTRRTRGLCPAKAMVDVFVISKKVWEVNMTAFLPTS